MEAPPQCCSFFMRSTASIHGSGYATAIRPPRNSRISGRASSHISISISTRAVDGEIAELVVSALGQHEMGRAERVQHRELVADGRRGVIPLEEGAARLQQPMKSLGEARARVRTTRHCRSRAETQTVMMIVLVRAARPGEPVRLVLDVAPQEIAKRTQRLDLEGAERIARLLHVL